MAELGGLPGDDLTSDGGRGVVTGGWKVGFIFLGSPCPGPTSREQERK